VSAVGGSEAPSDPFYSVLERAIDEKMPSRATPAPLRGLRRGSSSAAVLT
jgi:hypothetical protein